MNPFEGMDAASELAFRAVIIAHLEAGGNLAKDGEGHLSDHIADQCVRFALVDCASYEPTDADPNSELAWRLRLSIPVRAAFSAYYLAGKATRVDDFTYMPESVMRSVLEAIPMERSALPDVSVLTLRMKLILLELESFAHRGMAAEERTT